jgi:DNA polymerase-1
MNMNSRQTPKQTLFLVDGSSYIYRAFHALPNLTNSHGEATGAILGVANMLRRLLQESDPQNIAIVFDAKGKTFRHERYPEYKANRPPMPPELSKQVEAILDFVKLLGLPLLQVEGVEADDVIGTLSRDAEEQGMDCVISTGDKDLAQLVTGQTRLVNTMTDEQLDQAGVREKFGVRPDQIIDFLSLTGDKSDNIPGVDKCGPKTAVKWLEQYETLDGVIEHAADIGGKIGENLRAALDTLPLSRELVTINRDLELEISPADLQRGEVDEAGLRKVLEKYEFSSWLKELGTDEKDQAAAAAASYHTVLEMDRLDELLQQLDQADLFAVDTETTSLDPMQAQLVGFSFAIREGEAWYVPVGHDYPGTPQQLELAKVLGKLKPLLESPDHQKVGQHIKYDMNVLSNYDIAVRGVAFDTMLESYVLNSTASRHDMDSLALKYLSRQTVHYEDIAGKGAKQISFSQVPLEQASNYAAEDADVTLQLHQHLWPRLQEEPSLASVLQDIEIPLIPVLARMEQRGVLIDGDLLKQQSKEMAEQIRELEKEAHKEAGGPFNLASPAQLQKILFETLGLPVIRKTPKGQPSTAEDVLQELADEYQLPSLILEHRSLSKLRSTYTDKLPEQINPGTGRVHTSYHQAVAATGRLSSTDPNLQNIPIRTPLGRRIRQAFIAPPGQLILACDYSQIELRIMAHLSGDEGLLTAFKSGVDVHRSTAAEVFGVDYDVVDSDQRRAAKAINFGLMYGMSAFGLARQLNIGRQEAQAYMDTYFLRYPGVHQYMESTREKARNDGYVETLFGRRLYLPDITASNMQRRQGAERAAINAPMQGTAADIIKRAMIGVDAWLQEKKPSACLIMQVHDELVLEVAENELESVQAEVVARMTAAADLAVPLVVDSGHGKDWDTAH